MRYYFQIYCPLSKHSSRRPILVIFGKILPDLYSFLTSPEQKVEVLLQAVRTHKYYKFPHRWQLYHKKGFFCKQLLISNTCFVLASRIKGKTACSCSCSCCCSTARRTRCKKVSCRREFSARLSLFTTEIINLLL